MASSLETKMVFCTECENLLYPTTGEDNDLRWTCRACKRVEIHDEISLVYQLNMKKEVGGGSDGELDEEVKRMLAKFAQDPAVRRTTTNPCMRCGAHNVAYFINPLEQPTEDMSLFLACVECSHVWKMKKKVEKKEDK